MSGIPEATVIILTAAERTELEGLARSTKTEHRLRLRARIVLLAADGLASRAIGRAVPRDVEATWRKAGQLLDLFSKQECANYLKNSGYVSV